MLHDLWRDLNFALSQCTVEPGQRVTALIAPVRMQDAVSAATVQKFEFVRAAAPSGELVAFTPKGNVKIVAGDGVWWLRSPKRIRIIVKNP